jgi:hypothetical protein
MAIGKQTLHVERRLERNKSDKQIESKIRLRTIYSDAALGKKIPARSRERILIDEELRS